MTQELDRVSKLVEGEQKVRENTQEEIVDLLKEMVNKVKTDLDTEKNERSKNEDVLLSLLENTCSKLNKQSTQLSWLVGVRNEWIKFLLFLISS